MDKHHDRMSDRPSTAEEVSFSEEQGDTGDWVHEVIAMTRPGVEIQFPVRAIDEREVPFVYNDFR